ncbi:MAG: hypothetical protein VKM34_00595 [Cyanobacteriota bacterium]|nr:hypothetical protein [Cyanobacteriota bacterium]
MAGTTLTKNGWSGASSGTWNNRANIVVDTDRGIRTSGGDLIDALKGKDEITGSRKNDPGVEIPRGRKEGERRGSLQLGDDNDTLTGTSRNSVGIDNRGFIFTGSGQDVITGSGSSSIRNRGFIFTQRGRDTVDVRDGGIRGGGFVDLGGGRNTFIGFGDHLIYGANLDTDRLLLKQGEYTIERSSRRRYEVERGNRRLELIDFDQIGSINGTRNDRINLESGGTLVVKNNGSLSFS